MENVGTWNSDYAILFFGALIAPFFLYFLGRFFNEFIFYEKPLIESRPQSNAPKKIKPKAPRQHTSKPKASTKPKPKKTFEFNGMHKDAVGALCSLGIKKTEAKNLVMSLCKKKNYNSLDSLIDDCFLCIKSV
jgi:hypothetical protein